MMLESSFEDDGHSGQDRQQENHAHEVQGIYPASKGLAHWPAEHGFRIFLRAGAAGESLDGFSGVLP
jgi:hypothetical protein